jgi:hypothetical protein
MSPIGRRAVRFAADSARRHAAWRAFVCRRRLIVTRRRRPRTTASASATRPAHCWSVWPQLRSGLFELRARRSHKLGVEPASPRHLVRDMLKSNSVKPKCHCRIEGKHHHPLAPAPPIPPFPPGRGATCRGGNVIDAAHSTATGSDCAAQPSAAQPCPVSSRRAAETDAFHDGPPVATTRAVEFPPETMHR